jgi:methyl-accepting chemotaxis protein
MANAWFWRRSASAAVRESSVQSKASNTSEAMDAVTVDDGAKDVLELLDIELKGMVRQLERAATSVAGGAQSAAQTLAAIRERTDALNARASGARATAESFSQAAEHFTHSASGIGTQVRDAGRLADDAGAAAKEASANVDRLRQSSAAIGNVVDLIAKIARQTALLALNSSIEAARAGEAGRGFAVVATEVKALASQTQHAIDEIRAKVEALQNDAANSIAAVHKITDSIAAIRPVFDAVSGAVAEQGKTTGAMVQSADATTSFIANVGESAVEIDGATRGAESDGARVAEAGLAVKTLVDKLKARCAILLRQRDGKTSNAMERLPCNIAIEITVASGRVKAEVHEIARKGVLIAGAAAAALPKQAVLAAQLAGVGDCKLRIVEQTSLGARAEFVTVDAEKIEDTLFAIHDENSEAIARAMQAGETLNALFETAVSRGDIAIEALFDENYVAIEGTNPQQHRAKFLDWAERALPDLQERFKAADARLAFSACVDRNGYLPVHNAVYSKPHRAGDVAWNTANSRNRRIFNDAAGLAAGRNTRAYLIQSYPRDMGNGVTVWMREIDVPIRVRGRHWGGFRTAYKL